MKYLFENVINEKLNAIKFLQEHNVLPTTRTCPGPFIHQKRQGNCGHNMILKEVRDRKDNITWRCRKTHKVIINNRQYVKKDVKVSVRENTWLEHCNLTLEEIIMIIYCWSNNYTNTQIAHEVRCSDKTVCKWVNFFRDSCLSAMLDQSAKIGGPNINVEIDESKFGKRKYYKGHKVEGQWIFGGRETENKKNIFMVPVHDRKKDTLIRLIKKYIAKGSTIHSDCWKAYNELQNMGYKHVTVNHSQHFKDPFTGACTNRIESDWRHAKVSMPDYGVRQGTHVLYLAEFMWRRKYSDTDLFVTIINQLNEHYIRKYFKKLP